MCRLSRWVSSIFTPAIWDYTPINSPRRPHVKWRALFLINPNKLLLTKSMESLDESNNNNQVCTESFCMDNDDSKTIKCTKCKRAVHYLCTKLPMYQLRLFFTKNYRGYICINCVKVPDEFQETFKKQEENLIEQYKREVSACENIIKIQKENENKLNNGIKKYTSKIKKRTKKKIFNGKQKKIKQALV